jgi:hypothetical protein
MKLRDGKCRDKALLKRLTMLLAALDIDDEVSVDVLYYKFALRII